MTKYTLGPWEVYSDGEGNICVGDEAGTCSPIADVTGVDNAHLIAAAPELLEACKTALSGFSYRADNGDEEALADAKLLEQAIAKAKGDFS